MAVKHVAIQLDGNRRYAKKQGLNPMEGHRLWAVKAKKLVEEWAPELGIKELTLYSFSMQNFGRSKVEINFLFRLFVDVFTKEATNLTNKDIKVKFIGRLHLFPKRIQNLAREVMEKTKNNLKLTVNFAFGYGSREEIIDGIKKLAHDIKQGKLHPDKIDENLFSSYLYLNSDPEIVIRTGGAMRTSNFLLWQSNYSEWFFLQKTWPEFEKEDLMAVLQEFQQRERRFGK